MFIPIENSNITFAFGIPDLGGIWLDPQNPSGWDETDGFVHWGGTGGGEQANDYGKSNFVGHSINLNVTDNRTRFCGAGHVQQGEIVCTQLDHGSFIYTIKMHQIVSEGNVFVGNYGRGVVKRHLTRIHQIKFALSAGNFSNGSCTVELF